MKLFYQLCLTLLLSWATSGCTNVHVHDGMGSTEVTRGFGMVSIILPEQADGYALSMNGIGAFTMADSFSLGYVDLTMAGLKPSCHVIFWIENEEQAKNIKAVFGDMDGVCYLRESTNDNKRGDEK